MARLLQRVPENAPGDFFVDDTCIDCGMCRILAPGVFSRTPDLRQTAVHRQPDTPAEAHRAAMALVACPTASIGTADRRDVRAAATAFPDPIDDGVYQCGYASESSYGASSYLIVRPGGNVLVDSPRAAKPLLDRIEALGGVHTMVLTHKDDVADHAKFAARFACTRVMHAADVGSATRDVERRIEGEEPVALADDLLLVPVPGHTRGSVALIYRRFLFSGDHVWWSTGRGALAAGRGVCWYSWAEQTRSMEKLLRYDFDHVLPGHGMPHRAESATRMREEVRKLVADMK